MRGSKQNWFQWIDYDGIGHLSDEDFVATVILEDSELNDDELGSSTEQKWHTDMALTLLYNVLNNIPVLYL